LLVSSFRSKIAGVTISHMPIVTRCQLLIENYQD
jgi:hypothetical protein